MATLTCEDVGCDCATRAPAQPAPTGNGTRILPLVIADLTARAEHGRQKYGTELRAGNGRVVIQDALEESYDQTMYLRQLKEDWPALVAKVRAAALHEVLAILEPLLSPDAMLARAPVVVLRNAVQAVRALAEQPAKESSSPAPIERRFHRWPHKGPAACAACGLERALERGPRGAEVWVYRLSGRELARGWGSRVRVPLCPPPKESR